MTRLTLSRALQSGQESIFPEGMRSWPDIELIRQNAEGIPVSFMTPREARMSRIAARGRSDDSPIRFDERDRREMQYGTAIPIALADEYILNTGTAAEATASLDRIVKKYLRDQGVRNLRMALK